MDKKSLVETIKLIIRDIGRGVSTKRLTDMYGIEPNLFFETIANDPDLAQSYDLARRAGTELHVSEIIDISDNEPDTNKARVRIDARKWVASKIIPSTYGDRIDVNVNKTIDIGQALAEARRRVDGILEQSMPKLLESQDNVTDLESVDIKISEDDIFD